MRQAARNLTDLTDFLQKPQKHFCLGWDFVSDAMSASFSLYASIQIKAPRHPINLFRDFNQTEEKTTAFSLK